MSWNQDLPDNATKIRVYPQVLTDNFRAVQAGDNTLQYRQGNYIDRSTASETPPATPTRIDKTMILYSKNDGTNTEMFILNDQNAANDIQITQVNAMGSTSTNINAQSISFDDTLTYTQDNFITVKGSVASNGAGSDLFNCDTEGGGGQYTVNFTDDMTNTNYQVLATADMLSTSRQRICGWRNKLLDSVEITIRLGDSSSFSASAFSFIIVGGR